VGKRIHVIINPAAGQDYPVLSVLNRAFHPAGVDWDVFVTKRAGDARRYAEQAVRAGVDAVAVYGGDGTVMEAAAGLIGADVPLAIFPGGTANVISVELGIPNDLAAACALVCGAACAERRIDVGQIEDHYFLIRVGMGFEAQMVQGAHRELKDRVGPLAYGVAALQALAAPAVARYRLTVDGQPVDSEGITCIVANAGSFGSLPLTIAPAIDVSDGFLDVVVVATADLPGLMQVAARIVAGTEPAEPLHHWRAREVHVEADPPQSVQVDGELWGETPFTARVVPQAVRVLVPATAEPRNA
jgi:YegS/Rv2252/BmrU family lipid kinase